MNKIPQTNHQLHFTNRLGCADCLDRAEANWLKHQIARDPGNYNPATRLFTRPKGFQLGHNAAVLRGSK